jgi:hypothetical protein
MKFRIRDIVADFIGVLCIFAIVPIVLFLGHVFGG